MKNKDLQAIYDGVYANGKEKFFTFDTLDITKKVVDELDWSGMTVLEIGCGIGDTAAAIARAGAASVLACDYSDAAIKTATENHRIEGLSFSVASIEETKGEYDCIVMQEVIEHTDNPFATIDILCHHLKPEGHLILTCPSFLNIRGYVWMTLQTLFDVPMSLTDKHFISPFDMEEWAEKLNLQLSWHTFRQKQAVGEGLVFDMKKRLTSALRDADMDNSRVDLLLEWLLKASDYEADSKSNGAKALYHFIKS
jgi:2-polyprenyl-3-methyl-5-hydroxy-6-metoxy-1,4-benzoquinol methylase